MPGSRIAIRRLQTDEKKVERPLTIPDHSGQGPRRELEAATLPLPPPKARSASALACAWVAALPRSVHALCVLVLLQLGCCIAAGALMHCPECTTASRGANATASPVLELKTTLGATVVIGGAVYAAGVFFAALAAEEVYGLAAALLISTATSILPVLLAPWSLVEGSLVSGPGAAAFWPRTLLAAAVLLLQAAIIGVGCKPVWRSFCWRSLKARAKPQPARPSPRHSDRRLRIYFFLGFCGALGAASVCA